MNIGGNVHLGGNGHWGIWRPGGLLQNFMCYRAISLANSPRRRNSSSGSRDNELAKLGLQVALAERAATR